MKRSSCSCCRLIVFLFVFASLLLSFPLISSGETDIKSKISLIQSPLLADRATGTSYFDVSLKNISQDILLSPIKVVIDSVSNSGVSVKNPDGTTIDGKPYFNYTLSSGPFVPNQGTANKKWIFSNPNRLRFSYTFSVRGNIPDAAGTIGPVGGSLLVTDPNSYLRGTKIEIPPGALTENKLLLIREVTSPPPLPDEIFPAGPTIDFSPNGTVFNSNVRITIPYNDADNDGIVDYTGLPPEDMKLNVFDETLNTWQELAIISLDTVNHTATFETNHFSKYRLTARALSSGKNTFIFTIPGLTFWRTIADIIPTYFKYSGEFPDRADYLQEGILKLENELRLNYPDVYGFRWGGSAYDTPELMDKLNQEIKDQYEKNKGKKFILVTHSWGNILGTLALQYNTEIKPDLFLTLSNPLGSDNITEHNNDPWLDLPGTLLDIKVSTAQEVIYRYSLQQIDRTRDRLPNYEKIDYKKWINYWDEGDIISGPLTPNYRFYAKSSAPAVEDRKIGLFDSRTIGTTAYTHALTSLDEKTWKDYSVNTTLGKAFRYQVWRDIEDAIGAYSISGRVFYSTTPLANVKVELIAGTIGTNFNDPPIQTAFTDKTGYFVFPLLKPGDYFVKRYGPTDEYLQGISVGSIFTVVDSEVWMPHLDMPKAMKPISPTPSSTVMDVHPRFCWQGLPEAANYRIYVVKQDPWMIMLYKYPITETCYQMEQSLESNFLYNYLIGAWDRFGNYIGATTDSGFFYYWLPGSSAKPVIAQTPMSGSPGTTFVEWGTGFTPNSTATLYFPKYDGVNNGSSQQSIDYQGHFQIIYPSGSNKPSGTYQWYAIDGPTGTKSNTVSYSITVQPTIAQTPMSGPPGTTFVEWGTGFTPNSTATLYFPKYDGVNNGSSQQSIDSQGHFEITYSSGSNKPKGTYKWYAIDGPTGIESNEVSYTIN